MAELSTTEEKDAGIASTTGLLDHLRLRLDILKLRLELAKLDALDIERQQLDMAQNAARGVSAKAQKTGHDVTVTTGALTDGVEKLVHDVQQAIEAAEAVIRHG